VTLSKPGERGFVDLALLPVSPPGPNPNSGSNQPRPTARPKSQPQAMGKLSLKTTPWTTVLWGTKKLGDTPLLEVPLPVGVHTLKLSNPETGLESSIEVEVKAGQTTVKKLKL
jgi:eukaryotic-like serine/threonine-protein kinase